MDKFYLREKRLNNQGYDQHGQYYGRGSKLFVAESKVTGESLEFRASDHNTAKVKLARALTQVGLHMDKDFNVHDIRPFRNG